MWTLWLSALARTTTATMSSSFALVVVVVAAVDDSGTCLCRHPLKLMPLHVSCRHARRRRGSDQLLSKLWSYNNDDNNDNEDDNKDALVASVSKNDDDHNIAFIAVFGKATEQ